ncbi:iron-regulated nucleoid-associated protein Lsr2 [Ornithinimicrobium humiphilum]
MTGGEASETVEFALDGVSYEIDLNDENATKLRETLAPWIAEARRSGGRRQTRRRSGGSSSSNGGGAGRSDELAQIREWGRANGFKVSSRGRVSQELRDAYAAAH